MTNKTKSYFFAILSVFFWSTVATAFKLALRYIDFLNLLLVASATSVFVIFSYLLMTKRILILKELKIQDWFKSAFLGLLNPFLYYLVLFKAYSLLPAQMAQPINYTWPIVLTLLSVPLLKHKLSVKDFIGILVSFLGVIVISSKGHFTKISNPLGVFLAFFSSFIWAFYWIFNTKDKLDNAMRLFLNFIFGFVYILSSVLIFGNIRLNINGFLAAVYTGFFEMGFTFLLWSYALKFTNKTARISNLVYLSPFISLIFIQFILQEKILLSTVIGLSLIILGILIQQFKSEKFL